MVVGQMMTPAHQALAPGSSHPPAQERTGGHPKAPAILRPFDRLRAGTLGMGSFGFSGYPDRSVSLGDDKGRRSCHGIASSLQTRPK